MSRVKNPRGGGKRSGKKTPILERLKSEEARSVLDSLLKSHPELAAEAEQIARALLGEVSFEPVADKVEWALRAPDLDDLNSYTESYPLGYIEPGEAAGELLDEEVQPFIEDIKRYMGLGLEAEALEICKGVLLGLYHVRKDEESDVLGWAPDFPEYKADDVLTAWYTTGGRKSSGKRGSRKRPSFPQDFVDEYVPEWKSLIARVVANLRTPPPTS